MTEVWCDLCGRKKAERFESYHTYFLFPSFCDNGNGEKVDLCMTCQAVYREIGEKVFKYKQKLTDEFFLKLKEIKT